MNGRTAGQPVVLAVTSQVPWPLDRGGHIRTFHMLRALARVFRVRVITGSAGENPHGVQALAKVGVDVLLARLPRRGLVRDAAKVGQAMAQGEPYVLYRRHWHNPTAQLLRQAAAAESPDILYLDHLDSFAYRHVLPDVPCVIDLHNVYSTLLHRLAGEQRSALRRRYFSYQARLLAEVERAAARSCDVVFAVSESDLAHYVGVGASRAHLVPNGVDCAAYESLPTARRPGSPVLLYTGALSWPPNVEAAALLARTVLPGIRLELPQATLRIVGRAPSREVRELASIPGVEVFGDVPDVLPHLAAAHVLAVPLVSGGGTRLKILEAFAAGLPVVSTPVGCEGLAVSDGQELAISDVGEFAAAIVCLLRDPDRADRLAIAARAGPGVHTIGAR